jgi:hypothetical protein
MLDRFFGQFLLMKGAISQFQLAEALNYQKRINRRIGEIAVFKGVISEEQGALILERQRIWDLPFGEIGQRLSLISPRELKSLVAHQERSSIRLGEALLALGHLAPAQYAMLLPEYRESEARNQKAVESLLADRPVIKMVLATLMDVFRRCSGQPVKIESMADSDGTEPAGPGFLVQRPEIILHVIIPEIEKQRLAHLFAGGSDEFGRMLSAYLSMRLSHLGLGECTAQPIEGRGRSRGGLHAVLISPSSRFHAIFEQSGESA